MNVPSYFELLIIALILGGIGFITWRGGQANPEGTGKLGKRVADVEKAIANIKALEKRVCTIEETTAKKEDIEGLERVLEEHATARAEQTRKIDVQVEKSGTIERKLAAVEATGNGTADLVKMIYQVIVPKGMK